MSETVEMRLRDDGSVMLPGDVTLALPSGARVWSTSRLVHRAELEDTHWLVQDLFTALTEDLYWALARDHHLALVPPQKRLIHRADVGEDEYQLSVHTWALPYDLVQYRTPVPA